MAVQLRVGEWVDRVMVVAKKVRREFSGGTFLLLQFSDRDGYLKGVLWDASKLDGKAVRPGDVVRVKGEVQEYQGSLQVKVASLEKLEEGAYDPSSFLPASTKNTDDMYAEIQEAIRSLGDEHLRRLLETVFGDASFKTDFLKAPAAKGWHHSYIGGLAEHTYDMLRLARGIVEVYPSADRDLLTAGVLLHDLGKIEEFSVTNHIDYSDRGRLVGHITLGVELLDEYLRGLDGFPRDLEVQLKHMILSHHGSLENGSPVVPMTVEALLLHYIDNMDAQVRGTIQVLDRGGEGNWTEYVRLLDRFIYRGAAEEPIDGRGGEEGDE